ncbi:MAG TPA: iron ABC transporter permease, partial [Thauera sp.]|nr:iron ABC transporter permease [Thauera sp.]
MLSLIALAALSCGALFAALVAGEIPMGLADVAAALSGAQHLQAAIILELRLPRAVAAFVS